MSTEAPPSELEEWLRVQEELTELVAHDMRNPMAAIVANLSFLDSAYDGNDNEVRETLSDIRLSSEMLLRLVENSVAVARLESPSAVMISRGPVDLAVMASGAVERNLPNARSVQVELSLEAPVGTPIALGDRGLFELMAQNMVANAVTHSRRRQHVRVRAEATDAEAVLVVSDEGPAFHGPEDFGREAQSRLKLETDARYSRGLALYVVGLVTHVFGGTIRTSREDNRTVVRLSFPRAT
jgi:two-component system OmpR family sensor kinase